MSHDTLLHRLVRPLVRPLVGTAVAPNHLTTLRLATGLAAGLCFATGDPYWGHVGAAVFMVSMLLDRADGELARQGGKASAWGHRFDLWSDYASHVVAFAGLGLGLRDGMLGPWAPALGLMAGLAIIAVLWIVTRMEGVRGTGAPVFGSVYRCDPDDALLVVPVAVWSGAAQELLFAAAAGAPAFAGWVFWRFRRELRRP